VAYADLPDLDRFGVQSSALVSLPSVTKQAALDASAEEMDSYFRTRYPELDAKTPGWKQFTDWGQDVRRCNAILATYDLMVVRGYNPASGADIALRDRYLDQIRWLERIARQEVQPNITPKMHEIAGYDSPAIATGDQRGW